MSANPFWFDGSSIRWPVARLKDHIQVVNGFPFDSAMFNPDRGTRLVRIRDLTQGGDRTYVGGPVPANAFIYPGDLVIGMDGDFNSVTWRDEPAALNQRLCVLRARPSVSQRFLSYLVPMPLRVINDLTYFTTVKHLSSVDLLEERIPLPPLPEQEAIVDYLDRETARIDALIAARQRMKLLLAERRDAELHLFADPHPDEATRPVPIRRLVRKEERRPTSPAVVTAFRDGRVMSRARRRLDGFTESEAQAGYQGVEEGDIVFHGLDGFAGAIGVAEDRGACSPVYHVCSVRGPYDAEYVALSLRALALSGYLALQSGNVRERAVDFRNWETLARVPIAVPPSPIQRARARAYMERRDRTEKLQACIERQVGLLCEHRQALITSAVTGLIDIPVAA